MKVRLTCIILLWGASALFGCARQQQLALGQFAPYVRSFESEAAHQGKTLKVTDLVIQFGPMKNHLERGICEIDGDATPTITINEDSWNRMDDSEREPLIFHELGHCVLHRRHQNGQMKDGVPTSLMNSYSITEFTYSTYREYYLHELFSAPPEF